MDRIRYYMDEHVAKTVIRGFRQRGVDVLSVVDANLLDAKDHEHLEFALMSKRNHWGILVFLWCLASSGVGAEPKWVADEIFTQIAELRKTVQDLQTQLGRTNQELAAVRRELEKSKPTAPLARTEKRTQGKADAPLMIAEFTDYQCPYCRKHYTGTLGRLRKEYVDTGKVR